MKSSERFELRAAGPSNTTIIDHKSRRAILLTPNAALAESIHARLITLNDSATDGLTAKQVKAIVAEALNPIKEGN